MCTRKPQPPSVCSTVHRERFVKVAGLSLPLPLPVGITFPASAATEPAFPVAERAVRIGVAAAG